jgi:hypothetical protein
MLFALAGIDESLWLMIWLKGILTFEGAQVGQGRRLVCRAGLELKEDDNGYCL